MLNGALYAISGSTKPIFNNGVKMMVTTLLFYRFYFILMSIALWDCKSKTRSELRLVGERFVIEGSGNMKFDMVITCKICLRTFLKIINLKNSEKAGKAF